MTPPFDVNPGLGPEVTLFDLWMELRVSQCHCLGYTSHGWNRRLLFPDTIAIERSSEIRFYNAVAIGFLVIPLSNSNFCGIVLQGFLLVSCLAFA